MIGAPPLDLSAIRAGLDALPMGREILYFPEIDSTNRALSALPSALREHGLVALTEYQSAGRGRRERRWTAPPGSSVLLSVLLRRPSRALPADLVSIAALSVGEAIEATTALPWDLKWPNDVLLRDRKVCGILAEGVGRDGLVVVGIGINVNLGPPEVKDLPGATSLKIEQGEPVSREALVVALVTRLNLWYRNLTDGPDAVFAAWKGKLGTLGKSVLVGDTSGTWRGTAIDVRRDGGLVVREDDGKERTVYAGDVSTRPIPGFTSSQ